MVHWNNVGPIACTDFSDLVVDDDIALEGDQNFTILVDGSMAMVTIIDDDCKFVWTDLTLFALSCVKCSRGAVYISPLQNDHESQM